MIMETHIQDPIHVYVHINAHEERAIKSPFIQRLRHIRQLANSNIVHPGACHTRYEHSLGVMELSGVIFDSLMKNLPSNRERLGLGGDHDIPYFRQVVRLGALFHDVGHLPFSHVGEKLLPDKRWSHEQLTNNIILSDDMRSLWTDIHVDPVDVAKAALGEKKFNQCNPPHKFTPIQKLVSILITGDTFGSDRMDYILRDAYHTGSMAGKFDYQHLIKSLRILPTTQGSNDFTIGITEEGLDAVEAMALARIFMYSQVYFHPIRKVLDLHLIDFLEQWLPDGHFKTDLESHLEMTDHEVIAGIRSASKIPEFPSYNSALALEEDKYFRLLYRSNVKDTQLNPSSVQIIKKAAEDQFGVEKIMHYPNTEIKMGNIECPVLIGEDEIVKSTDISKILNKVTSFPVEFLYVSPELEDTARRWLTHEHKRRLLDSPETKV